jgi:hypothetical protein
MTHLPAAAKAAALAALAALALSGCDRPRTVVIEKDTTIVKHEPTVVIREDHHDDGFHPGDHMGQPHGPPPPPGGDRRDDRR